jgi:hypothetical protein
MKHASLIVLSAPLSLLGSCANPIIDYTRARYYEAGMQAEHAGDLNAARMSYAAPKSMPGSAAWARPKKPMPVMSGLACRATSACMPTRRKDLSMRSR